MTQEEKDKITSEIERLMKWKPKAFPCGMRKQDFLNIRKTALLSLKDFINSIQVEQPNEDVEKFIQNLINKYPVNKDSVPYQSLNDYYQGLRFGVFQGAQWKKERDMELLKTLYSDCDNLKKDLDKVTTGNLSHHIGNIKFSITGMQVLIKQEMEE